MFSKIYSFEELNSMEFCQYLARVEERLIAHSSHVIAVCTSESETEGLRQRGAWNAIAYNEKLVIDTVNELTKGQGVDVIYDTLAGNALETCLKCVKHEGHIVVAGFTMRELPPIQISQLLSLPSFNISGVSLTSYRKHAPKVYRQAVSDALEMKEQGLISPKIAAKFPLEQINEAINFIQTTQPIGKVVIEIASSKSDAKENQ